MGDLTPAILPDHALAGGGQPPALVTAAGPYAERRFWEFFAVTIRNHNTRVAYLRAARGFCAFTEARSVGDLREVTPMIVAAWVEAGCVAGRVTEGPGRHPDLRGVALA